MKEGYYWVKPLGGSWTVGRYEGGGWSLLRDEETAYDDDMEHIGPRVKGNPEGPPKALEEVL